jgi:hypothetical protein
MQRDQSRSVNLQGKGLPLASGLVNVLVAGGVGGGDDARELCDLRFAIWITCAHDLTYELI